MGQVARDIAAHLLDTGRVDDTRWGLDWLERVIEPFLAPKLCGTCKWWEREKCTHDGLLFAHDMWGECEPGPDFGCVHHERKSRPGA